MSITDELREWAKTLTHWWYDPVKDEYTYTTCTTPPSIDAIRLDSSIIAIADRIDAEHERMLGDWDYWESTHIELPKDADDVPWNVGDRDEDGNEVITLKLASSGWYVITDGDWPYRPESKRHYHAPTVEDVLREFAYGLGVPVADSYVAATAAKLRLAEGEDA